MFLEDYAKKITALVLLLTFQSIGAQEYHGLCGGVNFLVTTTQNDLFFFDKQFKLYYQVGKKKKKLFYKPESDNFSVACVKTKKNHDLLLFQEVCNGSACSDSGIYGIYDPAEKKIILNPSDWPNGNSKRVQNLIGYPPPFLPEYENSFCCK